MATLEISRFIAASAVVLAHFLTDLPLYAQNRRELFYSSIHTGSAFAVQYFFVLSGFVMMMAHARDFGRFRAVPRFWWRRVCRIYPCYWVALAIMAWILHAFLTPGWTIQLILLNPAVRDIVAPAWTLHFEVAFYLLFGLCLLPYIGRPLLALWIFTVFWIWRPASVSKFLHPALIDAPQGFLLTHAWHFVASYEFFFFGGLAGGWCYMNLRLGPISNALLIALGAATLLLLGPVMHWGNGYAPAGISPVAGLAFAAIMVGLGGLERLGRIRCGAWALRLGALSYPLYILHDPLLVLMYVYCEPWLRLGPTGLYTLAAGGLLAIYAISAALAFGFDQPVQDILRRKRSLF